MTLEDENTMYLFVFLTLYKEIPKDTNKNRYFLNMILNIFDGCGGGKNNFELYLFRPLEI